MLHFCFIRIGSKPQAKSFHFHLRRQRRKLKNSREKTWIILQFDGILDLSNAARELSCSLSQRKKSLKNCYVAICHIHTLLIQMPIAKPFVWIMAKKTKRKLPKSIYLWFDRNTNNMMLRTISSTQSATPIRAFLSTMITLFLHNRSIDIIGILHA